MSSGPEQGPHSVIVIFIHTRDVLSLIYSEGFWTENREKKASRTCELSVCPQFADRVVGPVVDLVQQNGRRLVKEVGAQG